MSSNLVSSEVWPENDAFGAADADAEDEFMALREILFAEIPKPSHLGDVEEVKRLFTLKIATLLASIPVGIFVVKVVIII